MTRERKLQFRYLSAAVLSCALAGLVAPACAESDTVDTSAATSSSSGSGQGGNNTGGQGGTGNTGGQGGTGNEGGQGGTGNAGGAGGAAGAGGQGGAGGAGGQGGQPCVPTTEICNGLDDDCNNQVDEGDPGGGADCNATGLGECANGTEHCVNGAIQCVSANPSTDICDGLDNNCDGNTDEGNPGGGNQCTTGLLGLCSSGVTDCDGTNGVVCAPIVVPGQIPEACNGLDDNCNGQTDEAIAQVGMPCIAAGYLGVCQFGTYTCPSSPPYQLTCNHPLPGTMPETCNGQDDDCNGTIDDPSLLNGMPCNTGLPGVCAQGTTLCSGAAQTCVPNVAPNSQTEICNNLDDNCNGQTDEMNPTPACTSQNPGATFVQAWSCISGQCQIQTCTAGYANIDGAPGNGCECATDSYATMCNVSSSVSVPLGGNVQMIGKIETAAGSDWLTFNFTVPGVGNAYHPKLTLTDSAGGQYAMDVMATCTGAAGCSTTGGANNENGINVTTWEQNYNGYVAGPGCCSDNTPRASSMRVRIFRKNGDAPTCASYTVTATNQ